MSSAALSCRTSSSLCTSFVETFCRAVPASVAYQAPPAMYHAPPGLKPERNDKEILRTAPTNLVSLPAQIQRRHAIGIISCSTNCKSQMQQ